MPCNKLTGKQKEFAKKDVELRNSTEAAMQVYGCKNRYVAASIASRLHHNPKVKAEIERILVEQNLTEDLVLQRLREGLDATIASTFEGETTKSEVPDMYARLGAVKEAAKIMDLYPPQRTETRSLNIDLELEKLPPKELAFLLKELAQQIYGQPNQEKLGSGKRRAKNGAQVEG